jgi:hypothetical protein
MSNSYTKDDTIFVQIASYRDPELQHTLQDLFKKAKRPENISVGICHQYDMKGDEDKHLFEVPFLNKEQLRIDDVHFEEARGCCWARNRVQKLWKNEKWTLMIDSHMRFEDGWDEICVVTAKDLTNEKCRPVLTTYVPTYDIQGNVEKYVANAKIHFDSDKVAVVNGCSRLDLAKPAFNAFFCAHFCFASAQIINEIEYDPSLYFIGEEISLSARLWTLGYNLFIPDKFIVSHLYRVATAKVNRVISRENDALWWKRDKISKARVAHTFRTFFSNQPEVLNELEKYGLGKKRSLKDYERFSGVDFRKMKQKESAKQGIFEEWQEVSKIDQVKKIFKRS